MCRKVVFWSVDLGLETQPLQPDPFMTQGLAALCYDQCMMTSSSCSIGPATCSSCCEWPTTRMHIHLEERLQQVQRT